MLADAARILDESDSPSRPLYLGYVGSTGLEVGVLAEALAATYDVNLAVTARAADLVERQAVEWVAEFVGYPCEEGAFTSGGMISNLTGLLVARERALPGCRTEGFAGRTRHRLLHRGVAPLGRSRRRGRRHRLRLRSPVAARRRSGACAPATSTRALSARHRGRA